MALPFMENGVEPGDNREKTEFFLNLLMANQGKIRSYIAVLVYNKDDIDDILQETITIMWRKFEEFRAGTDFASWGGKIAYYRILYHRRSKRWKAVQLSDNLFNKLADRADARCGQADDHIEALQKCVKKLESSERKLLKIRYESESNAKSVANRTGKSLAAVYRALTRIHDKLARCVRRTVAEEVTGS